MEISVTWLKTEELLQQRTQPSVILERPLTADSDEQAFRQAASSQREPARVGTVWTIKNSLLVVDPDKQLWSVVKSGKDVVVHINAYRTEFAARGSILTLGIGIGLRAGDALRQRFNAMPDIVYLYIGDDLVPIDNQLRAYVGIAAIKF